MSGWKDLFQEHILGRGEMYYYDGAVLELHKTEHGYHAIVEGIEDSFEKQMNQIIFS